MNNNGLPVVGGAFELFYTGPNHQLDNTQSITQPSLVVGFGLIGPVDIPQFLLPLQPVGCTLYPSHDIVLPMAPDQNGRNAFTNSVRISIPNDPILLGGTFFAQWLAVHTQCGFAGCNPVPDWIGTSGAVTCTMGN